MRIAMALLLVAAANGQSFDAASIKPAGAPSGITCSGGPGTTNPGTWRCSNMPLALVVSQAFGFRDYQFSAHDACCMARFDFAVKVPDGATKDQFHRMLQNLLRERFKLAFHLERKEMGIYELTVADKGPRMKQSSGANPAEEAWWAPVPWVADKDGYPVLPDGRSGVVTGFEGRQRWTAFHLSMEDIAKTLADQSGRQVTDATGLKERYDVDVKWVVDPYSTMSESAKAQLEAQVGRPLESPSGPTLVRAVQDQLGLKMTSKKGIGEVVVIDHVEKTPIEN